MKPRHRRFTLALAAMTLAAGTARGEEPAPLATYHAARGFLDDPFALSPDGQRLALLLTDGATWTEVHFVAVSTGGAKIDLGAQHGYTHDSITPERVTFLDGERILVVSRDPTTQLATGRIYGPKGPARVSFGPATDIALATVSGTPALVAYARTARGAGALHRFTAYRRDTLKPLAQRQLDEGADGRISISGKLAKPLYFLDGYATWMVTQEGAYDKSHDIRQPDEASRLDVFTGRLLDPRDIGDRVSFERLVVERRKHDNQAAFVHMSEDLRELLLTDAAGGVNPLDLPQPLRKYDVTTLAQQPGGAGTLYLSLTVDPVNAEAVRAQKADRDFLDLYRVDLAKRAVTPLLRLDGRKRPSRWTIEGQRLALLRKHKGFSRGGADLEVYPLPSLPLH